MKYFFHPAAEIEFSDAVDFYERQQPGLGRRLSEEVQTAIRQICEHPLAWEKVDSQTAIGEPCNTAAAPEVQPGGATS